MSRGVLPVLLSVALVSGYSPFAFAESNLNFKIYAPTASSDATSSASETFKTVTPKTDSDAVIESPTAPPAAAAPAPGDVSAAPEADTTAKAAPNADGTPMPSPTEPTASVPAPVEPATAAAPATTGSDSINPPVLQTEVPKTDTPTAFDKTLTPAEKSAQPGDSTDVSSAAPAAAEPAAATTDVSDKTQVASKTLSGYVRVVPVGTKIPIIMDTAVDSETSQEGDEFEARTGEDLTIDGQIAVPAGSVIKGRIAQLNAAKWALRSGSVALKFDTVTTPDSRQIPLVANIVARGGVVHARRGMKDIAMDTGTFALPTAAGLAIGAVAGNSSTSLGVGGGALIGAGVGAAVGIAVLLARKGSKIDVRPGDELKIELAEDLHMPSM